MNQITQEALDFVKEAKGQFTKNNELTTYRNEEASFIALRGGFRDDCMTVYELGNPVGNFVQQLPSQHKVLVDYDEIYAFRELKKEIIKTLSGTNTETSKDFYNGYSHALTHVLDRINKILQ